MKNSSVPFQKTGFFSQLILDYIEERDLFQKIVGNFPSLKGFERQLKLKQKSFSNEKRTVLVESLTKQYKGIACSDSVEKNLSLLREENTFTVVTGHQLNLFTGPLYFLYKIIGVINTAKSLKKEFPDSNFVPVYWMATEDHDFAEINHFYFKNEKIEWSYESNGPVGRKLTDNLNEVFESFSDLLGTSKNASYLKGLFENAYLKGGSLADATRILVNELFKDFGLVILDGDRKELKSLFVHYVEKELLEKNSYYEILKTNEELLKGYKIQVNPREINLFYILDEVRERIVFEDSLYKVVNTSFTFSESEIIEELQQFPQRFSPNVVLRPVYQEVVLPNLAYVGGGGELAYWMQLKSAFEYFEIEFPILMLRNSVLLVSDKQQNKLNKLKVNNDELFLPLKSLISAKVKELSNLSIDFSQQKKDLEKIFDDLKLMVYQTDKSFANALKAQEKKQLNGLDKLEKRLLKAEKRNHSQVVSRIEAIKEELFPRNGLQERNVNFSEFYVQYGGALIPCLIEHLNPFDKEFKVLVVE